MTGSVELVSGDWKSETADGVGCVGEQTGGSAGRDRRPGELDRSSSLHESSGATSRHHR